MKCSMRVSPQRLDKIVQTVRITVQFIGTKWSLSCRPKACANIVLLSLSLSLGHNIARDKLRSKADRVLVYWHAALWTNRVAISRNEVFRFNDRFPVATYSE